MEVPEDFVKANQIASRISREYRFDEEDTLARYILYAIIEYDTYLLDQSSKRKL